MRSAQNVTMTGLKIKIFKEGKGEGEGRVAAANEEPAQKMVLSKANEETFKEGKEVSRIKGSERSSEMKTEKLPYI